MSLNIPAIFVPGGSTGKRIVEMIKENLTPRKIMTRECLRNAIAGGKGENLSLNGRGVRGCFRGDSEKAQKVNHPKKERTSALDRYSVLVTSADKGAVLKAVAKGMSVDEPLYVSDFVSIRAAFNPSVLIYRPEFPLMSAHCAYLPVPSKAIVPSLPAQTASAPAANAAGITQADKATVKIIKTFLCLVLSLIIFDNEPN